MFTSSTGEKWIICLAAVSQELSGLRRRIQVEESFYRGGARYQKCHYRDKKVLLVQTGIGREAAEKAAAFALENIPASALISFGFAGGLARNMAIGDLVLCHQVFCSEDHTSQPMICSDPHLISLAVSLRLEGIAPILGSSVTVDKFVRLPKEKEKLVKTYPAEIVDMESFWIGQACAERQVSFLALRAISDEAVQKLPPLGRFTSPSGKFRWRPALRYFFQNPREIIDMTHLLSNLRLAESRLTLFLSLLLQSLGEA